MSLLEQLASRFKAELVGRIISVTAVGLLTVLLARLLSPSSYGLLFLGLSILMIGKIFSKLGISLSAARYLSEYKETNPTQIRHIVLISFRYTLLTTAIVVGTMVVFYRDISLLLGEPDLGPFLLLGTLFIITFTLVSYVKTILQGLEQIEFSAFIQIVDRVGRLVFAVGLVILGFGAIGALKGFILASLIAASIGMTILFVRFYRDQPQGSMESGLSRRIIEYNIPLVATNTASVLDKRVDTILVGYFLGPIAVSYYVIGKQVTEFIETPVSALGFTLSPTYSALKATDDLDRASRIYEVALAHSLLLYLPLAAGVIILAGPAVDLVFGMDYRGAIPVIQILAIYAVFHSITKITSQGLDYLGRAKTRAIAKGAMAIANIGLNIILIPTFGVVGAAVATVITYGGYTAVNIYIMSVELSLRPRIIVPDVLTALGITVVMSVVVIAVTMPITGIFAILIGSTVGGLVWIVLSVLTGVLDVDRLIAVF